MKPFYLSNATCAATPWLPDPSATTTQERRPHPRQPRHAPAPYDDDDDGSDSDSDVLDDDAYDAYVFNYDGDGDAREPARGEKKDGWWWLSVLLGVVGL